MGGLSFLLGLEVLKGVGIVYFVIVNLLLVVYWVWLPGRASFSTQGFSTS
jgi:hypothetical protein